LSNEVVEPVPAEHLPKHLLRILEPAGRLGDTSTVLLAKLVVLVS
jgi:hypothetical protein